jgi:outer membrane protein assembly factor BamB
MWSSLVVFLFLFGARDTLHAQVTQQWIASYDGTAALDDEAFAIALDALGQIYVTGFSYGELTGIDYATVKYDPDTGEQLWVARYDGPGHGNDIAVAIAIDTAGDAFVTGQSLGVGSSFEYATVKYDGLSGDQLWVARYHGPGVGDAAGAIAIDADGNVVVTGYSTLSPTRSDYATVKYNGATGEQLWEARYTGLGQGSNVARALALDDLGNAYVTGQSDDGAYATIKYDGLTGAQLWIARYRGLPQPDDFATAIAFDPAGSVCVTGQSFGVDTLSDYATVKYDALTGDQLWVARYDGPTHNQDTATAVAVDIDGDVFVTGSSGGPGGFRQYATVKYDGATGDQLWVARYDHPMSGDDQPSAIVLDTLGNPYVTGYSDSGYGATAKYDAATGDQLWAVTYGPQPTTGLNAIAVDALANVYVAGARRSPHLDFDYLTIKYSQP